MAISTYTRAPKESDFSNIDTENQLQRFTQNYRQDKEKERQDQKQREATYLQQAKVDPIFTMSSYWQKEQGKKIQEFQDFLGKKYYQTRNKPGLQDLIEIQNHKQALFGWQQQLQADQQKYAEAVKEVQKDPMGRKYDLGHFQEKVNSWTNPNGDGKLADDLLLPPLIQDLKAHNIAKNYTGKMEKSVTDKNGIRTTIEDLPEDKKKAKVIEDMYKDPSEYRSVTEKFNKLPPEEKKKWLSKYPQGQEGDGIKDFYWETDGKYAYPPIKSTGPAPKGRQGSGSQITGSVSYTNPSDKITISLGKNPANKEEVPADVDVWGGYSLPGSITGVATAREYYDMYTGQKQNVPIGEDIVIKYPEIKYLPVGRNGDIAGTHTGYRDENGKLRPGYKIKAVLITRTDQGESKGLELTPELKDKLITKNPKLASQINGIPLEVTPKGSQKPEETKPEKQVSLPKNQVIRMYKGRKVIFDSTTKKFVRYAD
jgi:hypothetical protein